MPSVVRSAQGHNEVHDEMGVVDPEGLLDFPWQCPVSPLVRGPVVECWFSVVEQGKLFSVEGKRVAVYRRLGASAKRE